MEYKPFYTLMLTSLNPPTPLARHPDHNCPHTLTAIKTHVTPATPAAINGSGAPFPIAKETGTTQMTARANPSIM